MKNSVDCASPPGGEICCGDGQTPICVILDGKARGLCRTISNAVSESPELLISAIVDEVVAVIGEAYREEALEDMRFYDGMVSYESRNGRVRVTAKQVTSERDAPESMALG
jgi:hypothetical protein